MSEQRMQNSGKEKKKKYAIIGGGAAGISALKTAYENGFEAMLFEQNDAIGGVWRYTDYESSSSVYKSTVINTSREMTGYSDFPVPLTPEFPTFMPHPKIVRWFNMYVDHFGIRKHILFNTKVVSVEAHPPDGSDSSVPKDLRYPQWKVSFGKCDHTKHGFPLVDDAEVETVVFDGIVVCTGHHSSPRMVDFPGLESFRGRVMHSHAYKGHESFEDRRVLVVGIGNSAVDIAVELSRHAKLVTLSTRSGAYVFPRLMANGEPLDYSANMRVLNLFPYFWRFRLLEAYLRVINGDLKQYGIEPVHKVEGSHPTVNAELVGRFITGSIQARRNIVRFTEAGAVFENDESEELEFDDVIMCTGYKMSMPFLQEQFSEYIRPEENVLDLFKFVFAPDPALRNVGFTGYVQPLGAIMPIAEHQARWFFEVQKNLYNQSTGVALPSAEAMAKDVAKKRMEMEKRYNKSPRHTIQVDYAPYMDEVAEQFGVRPPMFKLWLTRPSLAWTLCFTPVFPTQYRLVGPNKWDKAEETIYALVDSCYPMSIDTNRNGLWRFVKSVVKLAVLVGGTVFAIMYFYGDAEN